MTKEERESYRNEYRIYLACVNTDKRRDISEPLMSFEEYLKSTESSRPFLNLLTQPAPKGIIDKIKRQVIFLYFLYLK